MAENYADCSVTQGFNFEKDVQVKVGHINALKIGDKEFKADFAVTDPEKVDGDKVKVVGVLADYVWEGGYAHQMDFTFQVSDGNKITAAVLADTTLSNTAVEIQFAIYAFDPNEGQKKYYMAIHTDGKAVAGLVAKSGGKLDISIEEDQSLEVESPNNYTMHLGVMPAEKEQDIQLAKSVTDKYVKKWGVTVEA